MPRIVQNGKVYDTDASTQVLRVHVPGEVAGISYIIETLYKSPKDLLFLVQSSGATNEATVTEINEVGAARWLEAYHAPESAYRALGIELEEA